MRRNALRPWHGNEYVAGRDGPHMVSIYVELTGGRSLYPKRLCRECRFFGGSDIPRDPDPRERGLPASLDVV